MQPGGLLSGEWRHSWGIERSGASLAPALYAGHSLQAGFATTAARAGKLDRAIQKQTRHKSAAMLAEYVREGRLFDENVSEGIGL